MNKLILAFMFAASFAAHAELGIGAIGSYHIADHYDTTTVIPGETAKPNSSYGIGALLFLPILPTLSARAGVIYDQMNIKDEGPSFSTKVNYGNFNIPLNVQFDLPVTDLYVFGGAVVAMNNTRPSGSPAWSDLRFNVGAGYSIITLGPAKLSLELEYQKGTKNISGTPGDSVKFSGLSGNVMARFTL
jgi:hypothetical protein